MITLVTPPNGLLIVGLTLSLAIAACSDNKVKSTDPVEQATDTGSGDDQKADDSEVVKRDPSPTCLDPTENCPKERQEVDETLGRLKLSANMIDGVITSAKLEVRKNSEVDSQATGKVVFKLAAINDDGKLAYLDPGNTAECDDINDDAEIGGDVNEDCDDDRACYDDDQCPTEKQLEDGVATLFEEPYDASEEDVVGDFIELQAVYKISPPEEIKGRFRNTETTEE